MAVNQRSHYKGGSSSDLPVAKKPKLDTGNADVWGDDFDDYNIEEAFMLATQMCSSNPSAASQAPTNIARTPDSNPDFVNANTNKSKSGKSSVVQSSTTNHASLSRPSGSSGVNKNNPTHLNAYTGSGIRYNTANEANLSRYTNTSMNKINQTNNSASFGIHRTNQIDGNSGRPTISCMYTTNTTNVNLAIPNAGTNVVRHEKEASALKADIQRLIEENNKWKESLCTKSGEVSNLRIQLKQSEAKIHSHLESRTREYEEKLRTLQKQLDQTKTAMELQKLETWKATDRLFQNSQSVRVPVQEVVTKVIQDKDESLVFNSRVLDANGSILNELLNPHLFGKSDIEVHQVKLESKFSLQVSTLNRKKVSWRPSLYPFRLSIESCCVSANKLGLQDSFDTIKAKQLIQDIFLECRAILYGLLITLRDRGKDETLEELERRDRQLIETRVEALENPVLLSNKMWYDVERGIEARRALGLLAIICTLAKHMSDLVCGSMPTHQAAPSPLSAEKREYIIQEPVAGLGGFVFVEDQVDQAQETARNATASTAEIVRETIDDKRCNGPSSLGALSIFTDADREVVDSYERQNFGFLKLLRDILQIIVNQRNSFEYSGVLTAAATLLTNIHFKGSFEECSLGIVGDMIRALVFSRPRPETTVAITELLYSLSSNLAVMEGLCHGLDKRAYVDVACGLGFFRANSCVLQILCWLLEQRNTGVRGRTRLCRHVVSWVWACVRQRPHGGPRWARCQPPDTPDLCFCRNRLAEVVVKLVYQTYQDFDVCAGSGGGGGEAEPLRKALVRGIMLLHQLTETDPDFGSHMQEAEGCYQWLLIGLRDTPHDLRLDKDEDEALRELLAMEDATEPRPLRETDLTQSHLQNICKSMQSCWNEQ